MVSFDRMADSASITTEQALENDEELKKTNEKTNNEL
jgi:hypothetical protein